MVRTWLPFVAVAVSTAVLVGLAGWAAGWDRAAFPGWLESIATLAAFLAAAVAAVLVNRTLKIERARDWHREDQERQAQARLVYAVQTAAPRKATGNNTRFALPGFDRWAYVAPGWLTVDSSGVSGLWAIERPFWLLPITIENRSQELIYEIAVDVLVGGEMVEGPQLVMNHLRPTESHDTFAIAAALPVSTNPDVAPLIEVRLWFRDSAARLWIRTGYGPIVDFTH